MMMTTRNPLGKRTSTGKVGGGYQQLFHKIGGSEKQKERERGGEKGKGEE